MSKESNLSGKYVGKLRIIKEEKYDKKQLTTIFLSLALAATTAFQPISISAADNLRTETKISLQDRSKKQSTKPIGYTF
ncbi:MAG: hypothetical protein ACLUTO_00155 [Anaerostipes sp.]